MKISKRTKVLSIISIIPLFGSTFYAINQFEMCNLHAITKNEAFRSAQMNEEDLSNCINKYHIRSILNLRGEALGKKWYSDELKVSKKYNVEHYDLYLSAYRELTLVETRKLASLFKTVPRPILIHCQGGADRSGLVSAMWKVIVDKESKIDAGKQLSIWYGHMPFGEAAAMDHFFENWHPGLTIANE